MTGHSNRPPEFRPERQLPETARTPNSSFVFRATLFDYNGVLVDDEHVHLEAFQDVLTPLGVDLDEPRYWADYLGLDDAGVFRKALAEIGVPTDTESITALIEAKKPRYLARATGRLRGFPGAAALVKSRARSGPVVIVSGALRSEIDLGLDVLGVRRAVQAVVAAEDTKRCKPDPEGYEKGLVELRRLGVENPERTTVVFEDSLDGVAAALAAGLACVGIAHSYSVAELEAANAHRTVETIADVTPALLDDLWRERQ
jgi:beta-phosphoglucomutase-like phosphatase (HAD superfamily)